MTIYKAVEKLKEAGVEYVQINFSGTDGCDDYLEAMDAPRVEPEEALWRLGDETEEVLEALQDELIRLFGEFMIDFEDSGSHGTFFLDLRKGLIGLLWEEHRWVEEYDEESVEGQVQGRFPFRAPPARLEFRVEWDRVFLNGELPEELRKSLARKLLRRLQKELETAAVKGRRSPVSDPNYAPRVQSARGSLVLEGSFARYEGEVSGVVYLHGNRGRWEPESDPKTFKRWEQDLRERLMEDLAR